MKKVLKIMVHSLVLVGISLAIGIFLHIFAEIIPLVELEG
ncbi:hypothetical protein SAMN02745116_00348 [Pilibacter termitis]|uniref:Uncharacterized protein n=1 Tax=Pilibacter termitis TaxID=263852 RepID=A0A1T4KRC9_9ENTE|nr:hypothetical protein SAMN02745116_00348 [Pilibacter termitis]